MAKVNLCISIDAFGDELKYCESITRTCRFMGHNFCKFFEAELMLDGPMNFSCRCKDCLNAEVDLEN